jgi:hypothetical protein
VGGTGDSGGRNHEDGQQHAPCQGAVRPDPSPDVEGVPQVNAHASTVVKQLALSSGAFLAPVNLPKALLPISPGASELGTRWTTMLPCILSATLHGVDGQSVSVELHVSSGLRELWLHRLPQLPLAHSFRADVSPVCNVERSLLTVVEP